MTYDVQAIRREFPILSREVNGVPLVYLDNGASAQKPQVVIDAITQAYSMEYANVHRGLHYLSNLATDKYEAVRGKIARFLNAPSEHDIVFTSGTTEGINLVSYAWAAPRLQPGDEIILSIMEHHANIVPWHSLPFPQKVPGNDVGVMFHDRQDDFVARLKARGSPGVGYEVDALGRAGGEHDIMFGWRVQKAGDLAAHGLVLVCRQI